MKETRAYGHLKKKFTFAHWCRIEGYASPGIPDANACYNGHEVWIEFKQFKKPKKTETLIKLDMKKKSVRDQVTWGVRRRRAGGRTFYAVMVGNEFYLINGSLTAMLISGITYKQLQQIKMDESQLFNV